MVAVFKVVILVVMASVLLFVSVTIALTPVETESVSIACDVIPGTEETKLLFISLWKVTSIDVVLVAFPLYCVVAGVAVISPVTGTRSE